MKSYLMRALGVGALFLITISLASAGTICPGSTAPNPFAHDPDSAATGCNTILTINPDLSVTTTVKDPAPYDGVEDTLVGVVNNSSISVTALNLTGSSIFGLDGDGICTFTFVGGSYCTSTPAYSTDPADYYGPTSTFTIATSDNGTVIFNPGIGPNGTSYFSLEFPPSANLVGTVGGGVPEPASMALVGSGFVGLLWTLRSRRKK